MTPPTPAQIIAARKAAGHTQDQAAALVYFTGRRWREWEAGDHRMHPSAFELYTLKTRQKKTPAAKKATGVKAG